MKTTRKLLGSRIKTLRRAKRLSQEQLAEKIDIDPKHLSRIEVGGSYPSLDTLDKIANALGVDIKDFFEFGHLAGTRELSSKIKGLLKEADETKLQLIYKIINAILK